MELFKYMRDMLVEKGDSYIRIFGVGLSRNMTLRNKGNEGIRRIRIYAIEYGQA